MKHQTLTALLAIFLVAGAAFAAPLADVSTDASGVYFLTADGGDYQLTVAGPDGYHSRQTGASPAFRVADAKGQTLADGTYTWELVALPGQPAEGDRSKPAKQRSQSGAFTVAAGAVVNPDLPESFNKDNVILDDLIVDGSACVGIDCANGLNFGFDTLIIKENNTRLKFEDTSGSSSFPSNDWRLTANDSTNGGANYFAIEDVDAGRTPFKVEAGAIANALYVDTDGDVGVGTATPVVEVHAVDGNTPTLRLEQNGSSGFTPQTWDLAGNETNFFIRDVTNGSKLPFRIEPGSPDNAIYIDSTGDVGLGTSSPASELHLNDSDGVNLRITGTSAGILQGETDGSGYFAQQNINNSLFRIRGLSSDLATEVAAGVSIDLTDGNVGINCSDGGSYDLTVGDGDSCDGTFSGINAGDANFTISSSRTLKENLQPVHAEELLETIASIGVYTYDFIDGPTGKLGLMAEDFHQVFGRGSERVINTSEVQMALWMAVQQLTGKIQSLEAQLEAQAQPAE